MEQIFFQRKFARFPYKRWFDYVRRNKSNFNRIEESIQNSIRIQIFIKIGWLQNQQDVMAQISSSANPPAFRRSASSIILREIKLILIELKRAYKIALESKNS